MRGNETLIQELKSIQATAELLAQRSHTLRIKLEEVSTPSNARKGKKKKPLLDEKQVDALVLKRRKRIIE